jgi:addiction module RelE/StbE family toxin
MRIGYSKNFIKQDKKLDPKISTKLKDKIALFVANPNSPTLRNHTLVGKYKDYRSIDITGDYRALYLSIEEQIIFDHIGTHSQLYY